MIDLYTEGTPNGWKVSIALEELGLPYQVHRVDIMNGDQRTPEFLRINPNGRIPAIVDNDDKLTLFESGAILVHLAEKTGRLYGTDLAMRRSALQWLMFQMSGVGPMMGQANVFFRYFPEKIQPVIDRYQGEVRRLFGVLEGRLAGNEFLAGDYSIADIATWPWVRMHDWGGVGIEGFPHLQRWLDQIEKRPAVQRGVRVPSSASWDLICGGSSAMVDEIAAKAMNLVETGKKK